MESICIMNINEKLALDSQINFFISHLSSPQQCLAVLPTGSSYHLTDSAALSDTFHVPNVLPVFLPPQLCLISTCASTAFFLSQSPHRGPVIIFPQSSIQRATLSLFPSVQSFLVLVSIAPFGTVLCRSVVHNPELHDLHLVLMSYQSLTSQLSWKQPTERQSFLLID